MNRRQKKKQEKQERQAVKDFFDRVLPGVLKFHDTYYVCGDSYRCVWAVKEYPPSTEEQAILSQLADRSHVTLRIYNRLVDSAEQRKIIQNATRRNRLRSGGDDVQETVDAENNLRDVVQLLAELRKNREPLLHCAVFLELKAPTPEALRELQSDVMMELTRSKINVDRLTLRQLDGFLSVTPFGSNRFGSQYERVLPASSVANLYPFNYSGKTDPHGFYLGRDKFGTNILTDFDRRSDDKTNANVLILGNSGQGKSHLLKGIQNALEKNLLPEEQGRGMMQWYGVEDALAWKVKSAFFGVEEQDGVLWGVADCQILEPLENEELKNLIDYLSLQASDGWGEGFEQRPISLDRAELYVHLWQGQNWEMSQGALTQQEESPQMGMAP